MGISGELSDLPKMAEKNVLELDAETKSMNPKFWKVPGDLPPVGKMRHELESLDKELKKKTTVELKDLLSRQEKLAGNTKLLQKLPDKGDRVVRKLDLLRSLVAERSEEDSLASALARLHLPDTNAMEWRNKPKVLETTEEKESDGALMILSEKEVPRQPVNPSEVDYITHKTQVLDQVPSANRFMPFSSVHLTGEEGRAKFPPPNLVQQSEKRTPVVRTPAIPLPTHYTCVTKQLSLQESIETQQQQADKLREAALRQTAARLATSNSGKSKRPADVKEDGQKIVDNRWREEKIIDSDDDDEPGDEEGGVTVATYQDCDE